jgi:hypothetical protein
MKNLFEINTNENTEIEVLNVEVVGKPSIMLHFEFVIKKGLCSYKYRAWGLFCKSKTYPRQDREGEYVCFEDPDFEILETKIGSVIVDDTHKLVKQLNEMGLSSLAKFINIDGKIVCDAMTKIARDLPIIKMNFGYMPLYKQLPLKPTEDKTTEENNNN